MLLYNLQNYYPENTVSVDPSLVCIVINRSIRVPPPHTLAMRSQLAIILL